MELSRIPMADRVPPLVLMECAECGQTFSKYESWILHGAVKHLSCPADRIPFKSFDEAREHAVSVHMLKL